VRPARHEDVRVDSLGALVVVASEAVRDATGFMRRAEPGAISYTFTKANGSPVTVADFVVQAFVASRLARHVPGDPVVAEEDASALRAAAARHVREQVVRLVGQMLPGTNVKTEQVLAWIDQGLGVCGQRFWTLDPIDGTKGLLRGGQYAIALALIVRGAVEIGIVGCPRLSMTTAPASTRDVPEHATVAAVEVDTDGGVAITARGRGAWWMPLNGGHLTRLSVSCESNPAKTRALHSRESRHSDIDELHRVLRVLHSSASPVLMDGQTKQVLLAAGASELLMRIPTDADYREAIWDQAAGALLVEEAGGRVTDLGGLPLDFTTGRHLLRNTGLIASNGVLHDAVLEVARRRGNAAKGLRSQPA
jgi:3'(2'), 5'-bisphosphate nucleotidase